MTATTSDTSTGTHPEVSTASSTTRPEKAGGGERPGGDVYLQVRRGTTVEAEPDALVVGNRMGRRRVPGAPPSVAEALATTSAGPRTSSGLVSDVTGRSSGDFRAVLGLQVA